MTTNEERLDDYLIAASGFSPGRDKGSSRPPDAPPRHLYTTEPTP